MKDEKRKQQLQDRQDYRTSLINKRDEIDRKIESVEGQIKELKK